MSTTEETPPQKENAEINAEHVEDSEDDAPRLAVDALLLADQTVSRSERCFTQIHPCSSLSIFPLMLSPTQS